MPSLDIIIPLIFIVYLFTYRLLINKKILSYEIGIGILFTSLLIHLILRSWVWMFYPLFIVFIIMIIPLAQRLIKSSNNKPFKLGKLLQVFAIILSVTSLILTSFFPIRELPKPTGNLIVGTTSWDIHTNRVELYSNTPDSTRSFRAQAWYPALTPTTKALWLGDGSFTSQGLAIDFGFPGFIFNHLSQVKSNSYLDAQVLQGSYPLIIISHGWSGFRQLHTDLAEELASHGYVVIGIEHTYGSVGTVFDDGAKIPLNQQALPPRSTTPDFLNYANKLVNTYAGDIVSVLNQIENHQSEDLINQVFKSIDLSSVIVIGHSTGGGAAVKVGLTDPRIDSVIGLDAWVEPLSESELTEGLSIPSLLIRSEGWYISFNNKYLKTLIESSLIKPVAFQMNGTTHYDFGMVYMFSTLAPFIGLQGQRGLQMPLDQNNLILNYLETFLKTPNQIYNWQNIPDVEALVFP